MYNNFYPNQPQYGMGFQPMYQPYGYAPQKAPVPSMSQGLDEKEIEWLKSQSTSNYGFRPVTQEEMIKSKCTHRNPLTKTWDVTVVDGPNNEIECNICHERFKLLDLTVDQMEALMKDAMDALQSVKYIYVDMSPEMARNVFQVIPVLKQIPAIYKMAKDNYSLYDGTYQTSQMNQDARGFGMYNSLISGMPMYGTGFAQPMGFPQGQGFVGQPMQPNGFQQPGFAGQYYDPNMMMQQPAGYGYAQPYNYAQPQQANPFYTTPQAPVAPQPQVPVMQQPQPQAPVAPQPPVQPTDGTATATTTLSV